MIDPMLIDPMFIYTAQYFLAALLMLSGIHHSIHFSQFKTSVSAYKVLPTYTIGFFSAWLVGCELLAAAALISPAATPLIMLPAAMFSLFFVVMGFKLLRGDPDIDCGCSLGRRQTPLCYWHLVRNALLIGLSLLLMCPVSERATNDLDILQIVAAVIAMGVLYLCVDSLLSNRMHRQLQTFNEDI